MHSIFNRAQGQLGSFPIFVDKMTCFTNTKNVVIYLEVSLVALFIALSSISLFHFDPGPQLS